MWAAGVDVLLGEVEDVWEEFDGSSGDLMGGLCEKDGSLLSYVLRDQQPLQCPFLRRAWGAVRSAFVLIGGVGWVEVLADGAEGEIL